MNSRFTALISALANTFCDLTLDIAVNKYQIYFVLFFTTVFSTILQLIYGIFNNITITINAIPFVIIYGVCTVSGYFAYTKSLTKLPVGLAVMIESGSCLFLFLIIDYLLGDLKLNSHFILFFVLFLLGIGIIIYDNIKIKNQMKNKNFQLSGLVIITLAVIFYTIEPYLIKISGSMGANEVAINLGYYLVAIPCFGYMYYKERKKKSSQKPINKKHFIFLVILISILETLYYLLGTISYINETTFIVGAIQQLRIFLILVLPAILRTDRLTWRETIGLILGIIAITGIYMF